MNNEDMPLSDKLLKKIYAYYQTIWKDKWKENIETDWLNNFLHADEEVLEREKLNMLYLLSKFMYFGNEELRQLLTSLYRDLFKYPIIDSIRRNNSDTTDSTLIETEFQEQLNKTRFLGVGNPSESGVHMLYYFRQQCNLSKEYFINTSEIFITQKVVEALEDGGERRYLKSEILSKDVTRYIFIDDFCGSGSQASGYLKNIAENLKFDNPAIEINYLMLFGTERGIENVKAVGVFDRVEAVFTLDDTFKTFSEFSRYFKVVPDPNIEKDFARETVIKYGTPLFSQPLGYGNCELMLGLYHNTPDNTLPIFWSEKSLWKPVFKRYNKIY